MLIFLVLIFLLAQCLNFGEDSNKHNETRKTNTSKLPGVAKHRPDPAPLPELAPGHSRKRVAPPPRSAASSAWPACSPRPVLFR